MKKKNFFFPDHRIKIEEALQHPFFQKAKYSDNQQQIHVGVELGDEKLKEFKKIVGNK